MQSLWYTITIERPYKDQHGYGTKQRFCQLVHVYGSCLNRTSGCLCPADSTKLYTLTKTVDRSYNGTWTWSADSLSVQQTDLDVIINHPPKIKDVFFMVDGSHRKSVVRNSSVTVMCCFDRGYPQMNSTPRFVRTNGDILEPTEELDDSRIKHVIASAQCEDSGLVSCVMEGHNKTAPLLVECKPSLMPQGPEPFQVPLGEEMVVPFPFRAHTSHITTCSLIKLKADRTNHLSPSGGPSEKMKKEEYFHCQKPVSITGEPPDLTLNLELSERTVGEGRWRLQLTNDVGAGHVEFDVVFTEGPDDVGDGSSGTTYSSEVNENDTGAGIRVHVTTTAAVPDDVSFTPVPQFGLLLGAIGCILVFLIIVSIVLGILWRRRVMPPGPHNVRQEAAAVDVVFRQVPPAMQQNRDSSPSRNDHVYAEIPDDERESWPTLSDSIRASLGSSVQDSELSSCLHPTALPSSVSDSESDGYFHPVASSLERATAGDLSGATAESHVKNAPSRMPAAPKPEPPCQNVSSMLTDSKPEPPCDNASSILAATKPKPHSRNSSSRSAGPTAEPHYQNI